jgi:hypothetical protein
LVNAKITKPKRSPRRVKIPRAKGEPARLSPLELLPLELLQDICVLSDNHFFPSASPVIGVKLSIDYIYMHFALRGLFCYEDKEPNATHQAWLFSRRWMTWVFFRKYATRTYEIYHEGLHEGGKKCVCLYNRTFSCTCSVGKTPTVYQTIKREWNRFQKPDVLPPTFYPADDDTRTSHPYLSAIYCRIPPKLLHGPWTPDRIAFLRFLTTNGTMVRNTIHRKGYDFPWAWTEALRAGNLELTSLLLSHRLVWAVRPSGADLMSAIEEWNTPRPVLKLVIEKMVQRCDYEFNEPELAECVKRASEADGDDRGWLKDWIQRAQKWQAGQIDDEYTSWVLLKKIAYLDSFTLNGTELKNPLTEWETLGRTRSEDAVTSNLRVLGKTLRRPLRDFIRR